MTTQNVSELLDAFGTIQGHYEYSPFGKITTQSGSYADENPIRFSSEYFDTETSLVYYNFRYYSPDLGRWLSKDPIAERGGYNLYAMVGNNLTNWWDYLGLEDDEKGPLSAKGQPHAVDEKGKIHKGRGQEGAGQFDSKESLKKEIEEGAGRDKKSTPKSTKEAVVDTAKETQNPFKPSDVIGGVIKEGTDLATGVLVEFPKNKNCLNALRSFKALKCDEGRAFGSKCAEDLYWALLKAQNRGAPLAEETMNKFFDKIYEDCCAAVKAKSAKAQ